MFNWSAVPFAVLMVFGNNGVIVALNLSPVPNILIKMPNISSSLPQTRSSYFGFSIVLRKNSIFIGAPRAQSTLESQSTINETGAVYRCPFNFIRSTDPIVTCHPYVFENSSNLYYSHFHSLNEIRDFQWLGGTMDGSANEDEPLLVCAPRFDGGERYDEQVHDYLHGICYSSANTLYDEPLKIGFWKLKPLTSGRQVLNDVYFHQLGQLGFSAHITANNKEYIMGAPGINNWAGSAVRYNTRTSKYDIPSQFSREDLVLTGYAVSSGYLDSQYRKKLYYVTTSPHDSMELGRAYVYEYDYDRYGLNDDVTIRAIFRGTQYGEYFGYAALVCDIDGDSLDDVLVTAPQYRMDGTIDIGAIYVYINAGNFQFQRQIIEAPFKKEARFGSTITNLGDINHDGFNDIAVGAPLANGNGAVVIYLGSRNGLVKQASQLISLPQDMIQSNGYFGHGLSKGVDIDGNGYNDLAIGAPNNEMVYIYRSFPIINVAISITASETMLDLDAKTVDYRICFETNSDIIVPLNIDIKADVKLKRITFQDKNAHQLQVKVLAAKFQKCHTFNASISFLPKQVFVPIKTIVTHSLVLDGKLQTQQSFCKNCAVLDPRFSNTTTSMLTYRHGCADAVCEVDLSIEAIGVPTEMIIGSSNILPIKYLISNTKEKAFNTQVVITSSSNLALARIPSNCYKDTDEKIICDIPNDQIYLQEFEYLDIEFALNEKAEEGEIIITAIVNSMGNEQNMENNQLKNTIKLESFAELEVFGTTSESSYIIDDDLQIIDFQYACKLQNLGPSPIKNVDFWLYIPVASNHTQFIDHINMTISHENEIVPYSHFETLPSTQMQNNTVKTVTYNLRNNFPLPYNRTLFQYCNQSSAVICARSNFKLLALEVGKSLTINLGATLEAAAMRDILKYGRFVALFINVTAEITTHKGFLKITQIISPIVVQNKTTLATPLWIYLVAMLCGIFLLLLLTFSLWKFGFFRRQTKDDMQQLLKEKLESERMKKRDGLKHGTSNENFEDIDISNTERVVY